MREPLKVRRGATIAGVMTLVLAAALGGISPTPALTFLGVVALGLVITLVVTGGAIWINRQSESSRSRR